MDDVQSLLVRGKVDYLVMNPGEKITPQILDANMQRVIDLAGQYDLVLERDSEIDRNYLNRGIMAGIIAGVAA